MYLGGWNFVEMADAWTPELKVSKSRKQFMVSWILQKNERWISAMEVYYLKVNTKKSMFFLQEDRLSFVLTLK